MSKLIPDDVRQMVAERADYRCEYCLIPESQAFIPHQIDHVIAQKHRGKSTLDNLAYSCALCNKRKGSDVASYDEETEQVVPLYNPRRDVWAEHFQMDGAVIEPVSPTGRVTVLLLQLNRPTLLAERQLLTKR
jgi:5-methylcytosine-specific restriction endonuclease McrA